MDDAGLAVAAAEAGSEVVRKRFGGALTRFDKGGGDFATDVDMAAERAVLDVLRQNRPSDRVVAEESGESGGTGSDRCWLVDPLCATLNFAAGTGPVAVNVALCEGDAVPAAAVADPFALVTAWSDGAIARRRCSDGDHRLEPSGATRMVNLNLDPPFPNSPIFTNAALLADAGFAAQFHPRVESTSLALAWVASGQRAAYVTDGDLAGSVHFTAGIAVCAAAGCVVTNLAGGPIHTGVGGLIAAADAATHESLLALVTRRLRGD